MDCIHSAGTKPYSTVLLDNRLGAKRSSPRGELLDSNVPQDPISSCENTGGVDGYYFKINVRPVKWIFLLNSAGPISSNVPPPQNQASMLCITS